MFPKNSTYGGMFVLKHKCFPLEWWNSTWKTQSWLLVTELMRFSSKNSPELKELQSCCSFRLNTFTPEQQDTCKLRTFNQNYLLLVEIFVHVPKTLSKNVFSYHLNCLRLIDRTSDKCELWRKRLSFDLGMFAPQRQNTCEIWLVW